VKGSLLLLVATCDDYPLNCISNMKFSLFQLMCMFSCLTCTDQEIVVIMYLELHVTRTIMSISIFFCEITYQTVSIILKSSCNSTIFHFILLVKHVSHPSYNTS